MQIILGLDSYKISTTKDTGDPDFYSMSSSTTLCFSVECVFLQSVVESTKCLFFSYSVDTDGYLPYRFTWLQEILDIMHKDCFIN